MVLTKEPMIEITNELQLHNKVVDFIRKYYEHAILVPGLGEIQTTSKLRCSAYLKGYRGGQPDILILNKHASHRGLAIELKTPNGKGRLGKNQVTLLMDLEENGFKTLVSNDYDEVLVTLIKYFREVSDSIETDDE